LEAFFVLGGEGSSAIIINDQNDLGHLSRRSSSLALFLDIILIEQLFNN